MEKREDELFLVSKKEYDEIDQADSIYLKDSAISKELIRRILSEDAYYLFFEKYLKGEISSFKIGYLSLEKVLGSISYTRSEIIRAMGIYLKEKAIHSGEMFNKFQILSKYVQYDTLKEKYQETVRHFKIDNCDYDINIRDLLSFLNNSNYELESICDDNQVTMIFGIPKKHFIYALKTFLLEEKIEDNYDVPSNISRNIKDIMENYIDLDAINKLLTSLDTLYQKISLDEELVNDVLKDMPNDLSLLEKSIYLYIKLCHVLTYDEEFYAFNEEGEVTIKHQDFHRVEKTNCQNNRVTCYEFNLIYAKFLSMFNIIFQSDYMGNTDENGYGKGHAKLTYRVNDMIIGADSSDGILQGDMANAKLGKVLTGLTLLNRNEKTKEEFRECVNRIYQLVLEQSHHKEISFHDLVVAYQKTTDNYKEIDFDTKMNIFLQQVKNSYFVGVDVMAYLLHLRKIIFNYREQMNNMKINIVANSNTESADLAILSAIIRYNKDDLNNDDTVYLLFTPKKELRKISFDELKALFQKGELAYLENDTSYIPNITKGVNK